MKYVVALGFAAALISFADTASAQRFCYVVDPTGTPLNIRIEPNGRIVGRVRNGTQVVIDGSQRDEQGRVWVFVRNIDTNVGIGWVFRSFLNC